MKCCKFHAKQLKKFTLVPSQDCSFCKVEKMWGA